MKYPRMPVIMTTRNLPMNRMKEPTQLMTPTLTRLDMSSPNTFLQDVQKLEPLKAGEKGGYYTVTVGPTVTY